MARFNVIAFAAFPALLSVALGAGNHSHSHEGEIKCNATVACPSECRCLEGICGNNATVAETNDTHAAHEKCLMERNETGVCFPASAQVELASGKLVPMDALQIGDRVLVSAGVYSEIVMFTHFTSAAEYTGSFVRLATAAGPTITLTHGHYVPVSGKLVCAESVEVGDELRLAKGGVSRVVSKDEVIEYGMFNPQTAHGDIAVEGIVASTYTDAVPPQGAHALLAPVRALFGAGARFTCEAIGSVFA